MTEPLFRFIRQLVVACTACFSLAAQDNSPSLFKNPFNGYVFDNFTHTVRSIVGVPGAAYLGKVLWTDVDFAAFSPNGASGIFRSENESWLMRGLQTNTPQRFPLNELADLDGAVWSRDSTTVILFSTRQSTLQRISTSSPNLRIEAPVDLKALGNLSKVAISPAGSVAAITTGNGLYLMDSNLQPQFLKALADSASAHVFFADNTLYLAENGMQESNLSIFPMPYYSASRQVTLPEGFATSGLSASGQYVLLADAKNPQIQALDLATENWTSLSVDYQPASLETIADSVLLIRPANAKASVNVIRLKEFPKVFFIPVSPDDL